jgi:restriction system protein
LICIAASTHLIARRYELKVEQATTITLLAPLASWLLVRLLGLDSKSRRRRKLLGKRLAQLDRMTGLEFEDWIEAVLTDLGFLVMRTPQGGDYGVDLIADWNGYRIAIEAKRQKKPLGNAVVRSVLGGAAFYECQAAAVVTQAQFTAAAERQALASDRPVVLIARTDLASLGSILRTLALDQVTPTQENTSPLTT